MSAVLGGSWQFLAVLGVLGASELRRFFWVLLGDSLGTPWELLGVSWRLLGALGGLLGGPRKGRSHRKHSKKGRKK